MTDREILELCAKAMGFQLEFVTVSTTPKELSFEIPCVNGDEWNPLESAEDYEYMESKLGLDVRWGADEVMVCAEFGMIIRRECYADHNGDKRAAKRKAGCMVAAEIGRSKA